MTIVIPKDLRSLEFTELTLVDLNDIDVDRLLPAPVGADRQAGPPVERPARTRMTTTTTWMHCVADPRLRGFDDEQGRRCSTAGSGRRSCGSAPKGASKSGTADGLHPAADDRQLPGRPAQGRGGTATRTLSSTTLLLETS